ncbi:MAG: caspase family protein [Lachnospiraceae bacterium]|nr:caspase family protein [Lachnospiraceae bacterium]
MKRYALCIGNNEYEILSKLSCAVKDAEAFAEKLSSLGFDVNIEKNLRRNELCSAIVSISDKIAEYDAVLLYYAGHGFQVNGQNILAPIDFNNQDDIKTAVYRAFPVDDLMHLLENNVNKTKVVIMDACRSILGTRGSGYDFVPMVAPQGSIIAFSTSPGQTAREGEQHGLYTESLLQYMDLPRKPIETVFKKVRTDLAKRTNGTQVPWEHTSLIGEFYLNPDTIYDGVAYSEDALADSKFLFQRGSRIGEIVKGLKSYTWDVQRTALGKLRTIDFEDASAEELFVLGRNIYQAACGKCFDCQRFITNYAAYSYIPAATKVHILNGMVFEIYYDSSARLRRNFKNEFSVEVLSLVETTEFYGCCEFINSKLTKESEDNIYYLPGQNEKVDVKVVIEKTEDELGVSDIIIGEKSHFYLYSTGKKVKLSEYGQNCRKDLFEFDLLHKMAVPSGYLNIIYQGHSVKDDDMLLLPFNGYTLRPREGTEKIDDSD